MPRRHPSPRGQRQRGRVATPPPDRSHPARLGAEGSFAVDPLTGAAAQVRHVQPVAAAKPYACPGCNQQIGVGIGHVVVVPLARPGERRHWHAGCWRARHGRPPGR